MPTQAKENYLKTLYHLHLQNPEISITEIGSSMGLSKPTANDMVKKMHANGWLEYEKYKPIRFTPKGILVAARVVRKHRLSEMFLTQIMGLGWEEVHEVAEEMEHIKSDKFFDRMDELLGFPSTDPHGSPIPNKNGEVQKINYPTLAEFDAGKTVLLKAIKNSTTEFIEYLNKKGIRLGIEFTIQEIESFDKSFLVNYGGTKNQYLSNAVAKRLLVEVL